MKREILKEAIKAVLLEREFKRKILLNWDSKGC